MLFILKKKKIVLIFIGCFQISNMNDRNQRSQNDEPGPSSAGLDYQMLDDREVFRASQHGQDQQQRRQGVDDDHQRGVRPWWDNSKMYNGHETYAQRKSRKRYCADFGEDFLDGDAFILKLKTDNKKLKLEQRTIKAENSDLKENNRIISDDLKKLETENAKLKSICENRYSADRVYDGSERSKRLQQFQRVVVAKLSNDLGKSLSKIQSVLNESARFQKKCGELANVKWQTEGIVFGNGLKDFDNLSETDYSFFKQLVDLWEETDQKQVADLPKLDDWVFSKNHSSQKSVSGKNSTSAEQNEKITADYRQSKFVNKQKLGSNDRQIGAKIADYEDLITPKFYEVPEKDDEVPQTQLLDLNASSDEEC